MQGRGLCRLNLLNLIILENDSITLSLRVILHCLQTNHFSFSFFFRQVSSARITKFAKGNNAEENTIERDYEFKEEIENEVNHEEAIDILKLNFKLKTKDFKEEIQIKQKSKDMKTSSLDKPLVY